MRNTQLTVRGSVDIPILDGDDVGTFFYFDGLVRGEEHFAIRLGRPDPDRPLVRIHSECITGDLFGSQKCDCGKQLKEAMRTFSVLGGWLLYMRQEGRGIGLNSKLDAYRLQGRGFDTYEANRMLGFGDDERDYGDAARMLRALRMTKIELLTNNPQKADCLRRNGIEVAALRCTGVYANPHNLGYLRAKRDRTQHTLELGAVEPRDPSPSRDSSRPRDAVSTHNGTPRVDAVGIVWPPVPEAAALMECAPQAAR